MNLTDLLNGFKASPRSEIRKINEILKREEYVDYYSYSLNEFLEMLFNKSAYASYETSFQSFYNNMIISGSWQDGLSDCEIVLNSYILYCELLFNLLNSSQTIYAEYFSAFSEDINQLMSIINLGLQSIGFKMIKKGKTFVAEKIDIVAETVSGFDKGYQECIIDYLTSKTISEKESALTSFAIKLEAMESKNKYIKQNREFVQLLRHKEEKKKETHYSWFFETTSYSKNLDKLFKIFVSMIAYDDCSSYVDEFVTKTRSGC